MRHGLMHDAWMMAAWIDILALGSNVIVIIRAEKENRCTEGERLERYLYNIASSIFHIIVVVIIMIVT